MHIHLQTTLFLDSTWPALAGSALIAEVGGMSNPTQGINGPTFQPSYILSPSAPHLVMAWPFGIREKNFMPWYQQQLSVFTPMITSVIPPKPLISFLTNIPQVTFPICLKSDSLMGVSVENLDNSWCGVTVRTDGENQNLEISLGYYNLAQSLGTRSSGRTDTLYLSLSMRLSSDAINQSWKSMFFSGQPKSHTCSAWFLNWAGNSDAC